MTCEEIINKHVEPGEALIWFGKPRQGIMFKTSDFFEIPLLAVSFGFGAFWLYKVVTSLYPTPATFYLVGGAFVFAYGYSFFGRFIADRNFRKRVCYGITSKRIIIDYQSPDKAFRSFSTKVAIPDIPTQGFAIASLPKIEVIKKEGSPYGTIKFGLPPAYSSLLGGRTGGSAVVVETEFRAIEEYQKAYDLLITMRSDMSAEANL